jgi:hypothetical protein
MRFYQLCQNFIARAVAGRRQSVFSGRDDLFNDASKPT